MGKRKFVTEEGECTYEKAEAAIWQSEILTIEEKGYYQTLKSFRNRKSKQCFPSMRKVCDRAGINIKTGYIYRKKLQALGIIEYTSERGRNHSCHYRIILEDGNSQEISRALDNLSGNKIVGLKDHLNRVMKSPLNRVMKSPSFINNQTNRNKRKETDGEKGVVLDFSLKEKAIEKEEPKEKGTWNFSDPPANDLTDVGPYPGWKEKAEKRKEQGIRGKVKESKEVETLPEPIRGFDFTRLIVAQNKERDPEWKRSGPGFMMDEVPVMDKLLESNRACDVAAVLRYHHDNRIDVECLDTPTHFAAAYEGLKAKYMEHAASAKALAN